MQGQMHVQLQSVINEARESAECRRQVTMAVPQPATTGSTVRRILPGGQLRLLREAAGISRADAGYTIRAPESKICRMEPGRVSFKERDVVELLTLYGL